MDANEDANHLDADALLPPRKRLLAGLKKQSCSESTSQCSQENNRSPSKSPSPSPSPSPISPNPLSEFDVRLNNLLRSYKNGSNMSPEEIARAAGSAAAVAARAAEAARAAAEEKAAIAAKAVAAAKNAIDLVASLSEETGSSKDKHSRKNKLKKHVPVQLLYKKYQPVENCGTDEELARRLHRAMNSSPRITKNSPGSDSKNHKHKKLKISPPGENAGVSLGINCNENGKLPLGCNGDAVEGGVDCEGSNEDTYSDKMDDKVLKSSKLDEVEVDSGEAQSSHSKEKAIEPSEDVCVNGRKRGRIKQKKLPLSICSFKDQANPKDEVNQTNSLLTKARTDKSTARHVSLLPAETSADNVTPIQVPPTWKCQDFKVSQCINQDKVMQS